MSTQELPSWTKWCCENCQKMEEGQGSVSMHDDLAYVQDLILKALDDRIA